MIDLLVEKPGEDSNTSLLLLFLENSVEINQNFSQFISAVRASDSSMDGSDWRMQLSPESRQRIVNKIMETFKRHLPVSGPEGLVELKKIAVRFEEKTYTAARSQTEYLRKISLKMLTWENKSQPNGGSSAP